MVSDKKTGIMISILALAVLFASVVCTAGKYRYECTNTCETRIVWQVLGVTVSDITYSNDISNWVRNVTETSINNQWNLRNYSSLWSRMDGTSSKKGYLISRLYRVRGDLNATMFLKKIQGESDPIPNDLAVAIQEFIDGACTVGGTDIHVGARSAGKIKEQPDQK